MTAETAVVEIVKVADVAPAATVTLAGRVALAELDVSVTTEPPGPAAPDRVTVPVEEVPPVRVDGDKVTLESVAGVIVRVAVFVTPFELAVIVEVSVLDTATVVIVNVPVVAPAATVTVAGTVEFALLAVRFTR